MAKKTNKTDHVLNLLSGGEAKRETDKSKDREPAPPVIPEGTVSVVESVAEEEQVADTIRESLEQELLEMEKDESTKIIRKPAATELQPTREAGEIVSTKEEVSGTKEEVFDTKGEATNTKEEVTDTSFAFVNVMERLVQEKALYYMKQFGICVCPRCIADVTALALNKLPPKYVVVNQDAVSPLINFYTNKYAGQITVEITKACIRVGENPYHIMD